MMATPSPAVIARKRAYNREWDRAHRDPAERRAQARAAYQRRLTREGKLDMPVLDKQSAAAVARALQGLLDDAGWGYVEPGTVSLEAIRAEAASHIARIREQDRRTGRTDHSRMERK